MKVYCHSSECDLEGEVDADTDFDGTFTLVCADTGETLLVNGWLFVVEKVVSEPETATL